MATIVLVIGTSTASLYSSLQFARSMVARGHRVSYLCLADSEARVTANGFHARVVYRRWFPEGTARMSRVLPLGLAKLAQMRGRATHSRQFLQALLDDEEVEFQTAVRELAPDMLLHVHAGQLMMSVALLGYGMGIPSAYLRDVLGFGADPLVPPVWTGILPTGSLLNRIRIELCWRISSVQRSLRKLLPLAGLDVDCERGLARLAEKCGYPWAERDSSGLPTYGLRLVEFVLCPEAFDFAGAARPGRYYLGTCIDPDREEGDEFDWRRLDERRPLIYCALGTLNWYSRQSYLRFFQELIAAARHRPDWQWLLKVGNDLDQHDFPDIPENVIVVQRAPQLAVLRRASMMLTHAGLTTIKECLCHGVPMIAFPLGYDQFGYAARIVYHGLGLRADFRKVRAEDFIRLVDRIARDGYYRMQCRSMRARVLAANEEGLGLDLIDAIVAER